TVEAPNFEGKYYPTYFEPRIKQSKGRNGSRWESQGQVWERTAAPDARTKWVFTTDAVNDYFTRAKDPGTFAAEIITPSGPVPIDNMLGPVLHNGKCHISFEVPAALRQSSSIGIRFVVTDASRIEPFVYSAVLTLREPEHNGSHGGPKKENNRYEYPNPIP